MARKRMIDPGFWRDEKIAKCTYLERLLFIGLWSFAEDNGVGRAGPLLIKADVFPYETLREADIQAGLEKLSSLGLIQLYHNKGQQYYFVINFSKHQTINRPSVCLLPLPEDSLSTHGVLTTEVNISKDKLSKEEKKENSARTRFSPPTVEQVAKYCQKRGNKIDPQRFVDFYTSKGWLVGNNPMKDWEAAVRTWETRGKEDANGENKPNPESAGRAEGEGKPKYGFMPD